AGAIESIPDHCSAFEAINLIKSKVETLPEENEDWLQVYNWLCEGIENQDVFALAFITGKYEVEKPQQKRYEVKLLSGESMHFNPIGNPKNIKDYLFSFGNYAGWKTQFTKSELAEIMGGALYKHTDSLPFEWLYSFESLKEKLGWEFNETIDKWEYTNPIIELVPVEDGE
ncbi:DUF1642 domain-containing protein, partial [Lactococcus lactis]|uniref:DUF1642 domain-containing protein n=1 Tax=Lactococcus lactis TaxID=1358 RepID=UPI003982C3CA